MDTRARMLGATEESLRETGMAGTGIKEIVARSGAPIGSVYHHFPGGKTQIVTDSLQLHSAKALRLLESFFDGKRSAATAVKRLFDTAAGEFEKLGATKGCAIGSVALDLTREDAAIREVCQASFQSWIDRIAPHLPWKDARSRRSFAQAIVVALEGAFVLGKAQKSGDPFRDAGKWLALTLESEERRR